MRWTWTAPFRRLFGLPRTPRGARRPPLFRPRLDVLEERCLLTAYAVTTTKDLLGDTTQGELTLRDALTAISTQAASGNAPAGTATNTVSFAIGTTGSTQTINLASALPALVHELTLDGLTQGGASNTTPLIVLNGSGAGASSSGLTLQAGSDGSTVRGLVLENFGANGMVLSGSSGNIVTDNFIGTDATGNARAGNGNFGIVINSSAHSNTVGGTAANLANVISGNAFGVDVIGTGTMANLIEGNSVGLGANGTAALGNTNIGVLIQGGATANTVGGTATGAGNVLAAGIYGLLLAQAGTSQNVVEGNFIGTDRAGANQHGNAIGVVIGLGATANTVGGPTTAAANVISGNTYGVEIGGSGSNNNTVQGNLIGTDAAGAARLPNTIGVVVADGAASNGVGGSGTAAGNVISANTYGLVLAGTGASNNVVAGNLIGTNKAGTASLANADLGVLLVGGAANNTVGGTTASAANVISGGGDGVILDGTATTANALQGNKIGTDITGTAPLPDGVGVVLQNGASNNTVGGTASGAGNTIAFNTAQGVVVFGNATFGDSVLGNSIFSNAGLGIDLGADGPTPNGTNPRTFPNDGQNFPVLLASGGNTVSGSLSSVANTTFLIQYFGTPTGGLAGQGKVLLGSDTVTTNAGGTTSFTSTIQTIPSGDVVTATATNQTNGDTSEFSS
jgi:titin